MELIDVALVSEMGALAADVGDTENEVHWQFLLEANVPLLNVRPSCTAGDGDGVDGE